MLPRFVLLTVLLASASAQAAPDVLVVCPRNFRSALAPWESLRRGQQHEIAVIDPPATSSELHQTIRRVAHGGGLKYVLLVGDVRDMPTDYADAKINVRWGSEPTIATDQKYADVDGDALPDVAVGRIPADTREELAAAVSKIIRYEQQSPEAAGRNRIDVVAGVGGFGAMTDMLIEAAGRSVFQQVVPPSCEVRRAGTSPAEVQQQFRDGSFAWIYLGHGLPAELDHVQTVAGPRPIMSVRDVPHIACGENVPLAVLVACYTGAIDARADCLAEELALSETGPVAVIAATRVSMPYGNTVLGCELLRAVFRDRPRTLGDLWLGAQRQTLVTAPASDQLRTSLDSVARGVSPPPADLEAERREHVLMYQLLGDPLLRPAYPRESRVAAQAGPAAASTR